MAIKCPPEGSNGILIPPFINLRPQPTTKFALQQGLLPTRSVCRNARISVTRASAVKKRFTFFFFAMVRLLRNGSSLPCILIGSIAAAVCEATVHAGRARDRLARFDEANDANA